MLSAQQKEPKKASSGSISMRTGSYDEDTNPFTKEYDSPKAMLEDLYRHSLDIKSPYYKQAKEARKELKAKFGTQIPNMTLQFTSGYFEGKAVEELGRKFGYSQYSNWIKEHVAEAKRNAT